MDASRWATVALVTPGCVLAAASVVALVLAAFDRHPMWPYQPTNLAEAAGARDEAELVRLIEDGEDPNIRYPVRAGVIFGYPARLTPLEAAVASDDSAMVTQLLAKGAAMDAALWTYLRCIAEGDEVPPTLDQYRPAGALLRCDDVRPPWPLDGER